MLAFLATSVVAFVLYLLLTLPSGTLGVWSAEELITGAVLSIVTGWVARRVVFPRERKGTLTDLRMINPLRLLLFLVYIVGPFFYAMAKANLDVAYRVVTRKLRPGIVKLSPGLTTDLGTTLLANSITLTPGTLTVDVDEEAGDLYVHWIHVRDPEPDAKQVCGSFPAWVRRITQ
jgi:multicomponent Na+:H+ antiporter subunit E